MILNILYLRLLNCSKLFKKRSLHYYQLLHPLHLQCQQYLPSSPDLLHCVEILLQTSLTFTRFCSWARSSPVTRELLQHSLMIHWRSSDRETLPSKLIRNMITMVLILVITQAQLQLLILWSLHQQDQPMITQSRMKHQLIKRNKSQVSRTEPCFFRWIVNIKNRISSWHV